MYRLFFCFRCMWLVEQLWEKMSKTPYSLCRKENMSQCSDYKLLNRSGKMNSDTKWSVTTHSPNIKFAIRDLCFTRVVLTLCAHQLTQSTSAFLTSRHRGYLSVVREDQSEFMWTALIQQPATHTSEVHKVFLNRIHRNKEDTKAHTHFD